MYKDGKFIKDTSKYTKADPWLVWPLTIIITMLFYPLIWLVSTTKKKNKNKKSRSIIIKF